jgi:hypothetical protein
VSDARVNARVARYIPAWLPPEQCSAFTTRLAAAFERYEAAHGWRALSDALTRGRVVGGVASAFKSHRLDAAWGRGMLARRGALARLHQIAETGYQRRAYFEALGQAGGIASGASRRRRSLERRLWLADPRLTAHAQAVLYERRRVPCSPTSERDASEESMGLSRLQRISK